MSEHGCGMPELCSLKQMSCPTIPWAASGFCWCQPCGKWVFIMNLLWILTHTQTIRITLKGWLKCHQDSKRTVFCSFGRNSEESRISNQSFVMVWREGQASLWLETDKPCFGRRRVLGPHLGQGSHFFLPRLSREWWLLFIPNTRHWSDWPEF